MMFAVIAPRGFEVNVTNGTGIVLGNICVKCWEIGSFGDGMEVYGDF